MSVRKPRKPTAPNPTTTNSTTPPAESSVTPRKRARGLFPGVRFADQATALSDVYTDYEVTVTVNGEVFTPANIQQIAAEQAAEEREDARLLAAYQNNHVVYTNRANTRAKRMLAALKAARGALSGNPVAMQRLKRASFRLPRANRAGDTQQGDATTPSTSEKK